MTGSLRSQYRCFDLFLLLSFLLEGELAFLLFFPFAFILFSFVSHESYSFIHGVVIVKLNELECSTNTLQQLLRIILEKRVPANGYHVDLGTTPHVMHPGPIQALPIGIAFLADEFQRKPTNPADIGELRKNQKESHVWLP